MEVWQDAFKTSQTIFKLVQYLDTQQTKKIYLLTYFENMSKIFFESKHYMFHTYALFNLIEAVKRNIRFTVLEKQELTSKFIFAALSVPLNHRLSNFERLSTQYLPKEL